MSGWVGKLKWNAYLGGSWEQDEAQVRLASRVSQLICSPQTDSLRKFRPHHGLYAFNALLTKKVLAPSKVLALINFFKKVSRMSQASANQYNEITADLTHNSS